jgi:PilZ domain
MTASPSATSNRRRARRQPAKTSARVICYGNGLGLGRNLALTVLDMSESGIRLRVKAPLEAGQEIQIDLEGLGHRRALKICGKVAWSVALADGTWCVGVQFPQPLRYTDLVCLARF